MSSVSQLYTKALSKRLSFSSLFLSAALCCLPLSLPANDLQGLAENLVRDSKAQASKEDLQTLANDLVRDSLTQADDKRSEALALIEGSVSESRGSFFGLEERQRSAKESFAHGEESDASENGQSETSLPVSNTSGFSASPSKTCSMESSSSVSSAPHQSAFSKADAQNQGTFLVFVSFSMNDGALKDLHRQMSRLGGRLVLKGLISNSFKETQQKIRTLGIEADIDPTLFETYAVKRVPTYVLTKKTGDKTFDQVAGHISPQTALEIFKEKRTLTPLSESLLRSIGEAS